MTGDNRYIQKVIHVHFLHSRKNYYFGSVRALFKVFSPKDLGVTENYLRHYLSYDGCHYLNSEVHIIRSRLLR